MKRLALSFLVLLPLALNAQILMEISTYWDDSFAHWNIQTEIQMEEVKGTLELRWAIQNDWTKWDYEINGERGYITLPWEDNPSQWEVRDYNNNIITCRVKWQGDFSEWRITDNTVSLTLRSRWRNDINEWMVVEEKYGSFAIYTFYENDPRDWEILDELDDSISLAMKMALIFIPIYHSFPK